jgi:hypothetical protein
VAPTNTVFGKVEIKYLLTDKVEVISTATNCGLPVGAASGECDTARSIYKNYNLTRPGNYTTFDFTLSSCPQVSITSTSVPTVTTPPQASAVPTAFGTVAECKSIDINGDDQLDLVDFAEFAKNYSTFCKPPENKGLQTNTCGSADTNSDGKIDIVDLAAFASKYYTNTPRCDK